MVLTCLIIDSVHFDYSIKVLSPRLHHCKVTFNLCNSCVFCVVVL